MLELVLANLRVRPFRTFISIVGVAIGVVLVVLFTGLARGMVSDMARRASNWKAEIMFTRPGGMEVTSSNLNLSTAYMPKLMGIEGVKSVVAVGIYVSPSQKGRFGLQQIDGVDWQPFADMNGMSITEGRAPQSDNEVILDERQMKSDNLKLGDNIKLFGEKSYEVVGQFAPPSGSRIKMTLTALQSELDAQNKCTYILVKTKDGVDPEVVAARINEQLPGNKITLSRDIVTDASERLPGLNTFLRVLVGLGAFVSVIFVLLSMYTTITERRKEIGILKSLGASKQFIISTIEGEAFMVGVLGIILGFIVSFAAAYLIGKVFEVAFEFSIGWIVTAILIALAGSLVGALYPAWRASGIDPVEVMVNE